MPGRPAVRFLSRAPKGAEAPTADQASSPNDRPQVRHHRRCLASQAVSLVSSVRQSVSIYISRHTQPTAQPLYSSHHSPSSPPRPHPPTQLVSARDPHILPAAVRSTAPPGKLRPPAPQLHRKGLWRGAGESLDSCCGQSQLLIYFPRANITCLPYILHSITDANATLKMDRSPS